MNLHDYDIIVINSSGGKDSVCAMWEIGLLAEKQKFPWSKIYVSHQDLTKIEWPGVKELVIKQAEYFGFKVLFSKRRDKNGYEETLLEYVKRRGMWPSSQQRWCTSDYKRAPGARIITKLTKDLGECKVLQVFGFRKQESPARLKRKELSLNARLTTKKRKVYDYLPIHNWSTFDVWHIIKTFGLPYHFAYDLGMPRLSCVFCIFSPFDALVTAGISNPELLEEYIQVEKEIGHTFKNDFAIAEVKKAIENNYQPKKIKDWVM